MKKMLCLFLALIMCASLFVACGGEKDKDKDKDKDPSSHTVKLIEKDGVVYFENTDAVPEIILTGETEMVVEDEMPLRRSCF